MDDSAAMRVVEGASNGGGDADRFVYRQLSLAVETMPEAFALDERHDVEEQPLRLAAVKQREKVGVLQVGRDADLAQESVGAEYCAELGIQNLERDEPVMSGVAREVDSGHAAASELPLDGISIGER